MSNSEKNLLQEYCQKRKLAMPIYVSNSTGPKHKLQWKARVTIIMNDKLIVAKTGDLYNSKVMAEKYAARTLLNMIREKKIENSDRGIRTVSPDLSDSDDPILSDELSDFKESKTDESITSPEDQDVLYSDRSIDSDSYNPTTTNEFDTHLMDSFGIPMDPILMDYSVSFAGIFNEICIIDLENKPCFKEKLKPFILYIGFINSIHNSVSKYNDWYECRSDNISKEVMESKNNKLLYLIDGGTPDLVDHFMTMFVYPLLTYITISNIKPVINIISGDHAGWCTRACLEKVLKWNKIYDLDIVNKTTFN